MKLFFILLTFSVSNLYAAQNNICKSIFSTHLPSLTTQSLQPVLESQTRHPSQNQPSLAPPIADSKVAEFVTPNLSSFFGPNDFKTPWRNVPQAEKAAVDMAQRILPFLMSVPLENHDLSMTFAKATLGASEAYSNSFPSIERIQPPFIQEYTKKLWEQIYLNLREKPLDFIEQQKLHQIIFEIIKQNPKLTSILKPYLLLLWGKPTPSAQNLRNQLLADKLSIYSNFIKNNSPRNTIQGPPEIALAEIIYEIIKSLSSPQERMEVLQISFSEIKGLKNFEYFVFELTRLYINFLEQKHFETSLVITTSIPKSRTDSTVESQKLLYLLNNMKMVIPGLDTYIKSFIFRLQSALN